MESRLKATDREDWKLCTARFNHEMFYCDDIISTFPCSDGQFRTWDFLQTE